VRGINVDPGGIGVKGFGGDGALGFLGGRDPQFHQLAGVYGESTQQGIMGLTTVPKGTGVYGGGTTAASGDQIGVRGETLTGVGVLGRSFGDGTGVLGQGPRNGVMGQTTSDIDAGVNGRNDGKGFGVFGLSVGVPVWRAIAPTAPVWLVSAKTASPAASWGMSRSLGA